MLTHVLRDLRYAVRQLLKSPGFSVVAILTLALGIGATTAIFSVVNSVLLRPLPFPRSEELVRVNEIVPQYGRFSVAPATFLDWRQQNSVFEAMGAYTGSSATFTSAGGPERVQGAQVSWDVFRALNVAPEIGTGFTAEQDKPGAPVVIVLSHTAWAQRFGSDPNIAGRAITVNGAPATIIGVMPADFYFPNRTAEFWRPLALNPANASRGGHFLGVVARLKPGVARERAHNEMKAISERLATQYPDASANESAEVVGLQDQIVAGIRPALVTLFSAVGVVVLIACANVANLLLVRASVREKEVAIRTALGAGRRRLVVQMLSESLVLALIGGTLGIALGYLAIEPIKTLGANSIPRVADISLDGRVLAFAMGASIITGILFGLLPAWQASRTGVGAVLKEGGRSSTTGGGRWVRTSLLIVELALSIVLLTGATLLIRSFSKMTNVDPGFRPDRVLAFQVALPNSSYAKPEQIFAFYDTLNEHLKNQPMVESAGFIQTLPMRGDYVLSFDVRGRAAAKPGEGPSANYRAVSADTFSALGIPVTRGRGFTAADNEKSQHVAVIDEAFAKKHFPDQDPIGQGLHIGNGVDGFYDIVGIVSNVHLQALDATTTPTMYVPIKQDQFSNFWVVMRSKGADAAGLGAVARNTLKEIDASLPAFSLTPLNDVVTGSVAQKRFSMLLLSLFAVVALFLAAVGLYGVVAYGVSQRTREVGLRMAMGAQPGDVLRMIVGGGMRVAAIGVVIGLAASLALARFIQTMLFEVAPFDITSYVVTAITLLVVAALACYVPARRAMKVDPTVALQS